MDEPVNKEAFLDQLQRLRSALEAGQGQEALEILLEVREEGFVATNLDRQIEMLRDDPGRQEFVEVGRWVQNLVGQAQRTDDDPFADLEEVTGVDAEPIGTEELRPMSDASDVGLELQQTPDEPAEQGPGTDVHSVVEEQDDGEKRGGFDRESQPKTVADTGALSYEFGEQSEASEAERQGDGEGFEGLPSVDFAVVESEAEDEGFDADEKLEPLEEDSPPGLDEGEPTETGAESEASEEEDEDVFVQDVFGHESTEVGDEPDEEASSVEEEEVDDDLFVQEMFNEQSHADEREAGRLDEETGGLGDEVTGGEFELDFGEYSETEEQSSADAPVEREFDQQPTFGDGGDDLGLEDSDEWSALDAFESSELEADSSDFDFGEEVEAAAGSEKSEPPPIPADAAVNEDDSAEELGIAFDEQEDKPETPAGRNSDQHHDPNQTRQPFSGDSEAAEEFAKEAFEGSPEPATRAGSIEDLVGEEHAGLFQEDDEPPDQSEDSGFGEEEVTARSEMPDQNREDPASPFADEEPTAKSDVLEEQTGGEVAGNEADEEPEFDLGFENPGEDDSAGFNLSFGGGDDAREDAASQTPVPEGDLSDLAGASGGRDEPSEASEGSPAEEVDPFGGSDGLAESSQPSPEGQASESSPRYSAEGPDSSARTAEGDEELSVETEENDALSDEKFFQLADELSEPSDESDPAEESETTPTPHRGEPVVPVDDDASQSGGANDFSQSGGSGFNSSGAGDNQELAGINPRASSPADVKETDDGSGTGAYSSVSHASSEADEESRNLATGAVRLINEAERLFEEGNLESAHDLVQSVLEGSPDSERAQSLLDKIEAAQSGDDQAAREQAATGEHSTVESSKPPPLDAIPESEVDMAELADRDFDHRFGFILSLVDGTVTVQDICELSSMSRQETLSVLADMVDQSVITVDQ